MLRFACSTGCFSHESSSVFSLTPVRYLGMFGECFLHFSSAELLLNSVLGLKGRVLLSSYGFIVRATLVLRGSRTERRARGKLSSHVDCPVANRSQHTKSERVTTILNQDGFDFS